MKDEEIFFIFLLEQYAWHKNTAACDVLKCWDEAHITLIIYSMYERYHSEAIENAIADIDALLAESSSGKMHFEGQQSR